MASASYIKSFFLNLIFLLTSLPLFAFAQETPPARLHFKHLLTDKGISISVVNTIFQDSKGLLWFGGLEGLIKFDGYGYSIYRTDFLDPKSIPSNLVWDIFEDKEGLWFATDAGLSLYDRDTDHFIKAQFEVNNDACNTFARSMTEDNDGKLWVGTAGGVLVLEPDRQSGHCYIPGEKNLSGGQIRKVFVDSKNTLWVGTDHSGLHKFNRENQNFVPLPFDDNVNDKFKGRGSVVSIFEDSAGFIWLGSEGKGLSRLEPFTQTFLHFVKSADLSNGLANNSVMDIISDGNNNLWIATEGGLQHLNQENFQFVTYRSKATDPYSLSSSAIRSLLLDSNGDLWIGNAPSGVNFLSKPSLIFDTWKHDPTINSLSHPSAFTMLEDQKGNLWVGTDGGGLNYLDFVNNRVEHYVQDSGKSDSINGRSVLSLVEENGKLWVGLWQGGVDLFDVNTGKSIHHAPGGKAGQDPSSGNIWSLMLDDQQQLWLGTVGAGVDRWDVNRKVLTRYSGGPVWKVFQDSKGRIWTGTGIGLGKYDVETDNFEFYRQDFSNPNSLSFDVIFDIAEDSDGNLLLATRGGGLNIFDPETGHFNHVRQAQGLITDVITSVELDDNQDIWLGSSAGIMRIDRNTKKVRVIDVHDGLAGSEINIGAIYKMRDGRLAVGATQGLTIFDPNALPEEYHRPKIELTDFHIFNKPAEIGPDGPISKVISQSESVSLKYDQSVFSIYFSGLSFRRPDRTNYAYKLDGFDENWNYVNSDKRSATYTNLSAGPYLFRVKAGNAENMWGEEKRLLINIEPAPWATWWAYVIYATASILLVIWFLGENHRKILNERKISHYLEAKVEERTFQLKLKNDELQSAYEQLESLSLSDPLTGLNNRRFLQNILPKDIAEVLRDWSAVDVLGKVHTPPKDILFMLIDIDFFKVVNDQYGHHAGDEILIQMASILRSTCRDSDSIVRWGGEEFLIVSRIEDRNESMSLAERIRQSIEDYEFKIENERSLKKTCSIGFANFPFNKRDPACVSWENVVGIADAALYKAKEGGRNRCVGLALKDGVTLEKLYFHISSDLDGLIRDEVITVIQKASC